MSLILGPERTAVNWPARGNFEQSALKIRADDWKLAVCGGARCLGRRELMNVFQPNPEEHREAMRLEGWPRRTDSRPSTRNGFAVVAGDAREERTPQSLTENASIVFGTFSTRHGRA
jgi:hypothetical protein